MSDLLAVFDIGTTGARTIIFDINGKEISRTYEEYPVIQQPTGTSEQDPNVWWNAVKNTCNMALKHINKDDIVGLVASCFRATATFIDQNGEILHPALTWMDEREEDSAKDWTKDDALRRAIPKVLWFKNNKPEIYEKIAKVSFVDTYIYNRLCNVIATDPANGVMGPLNFNTLKWDGKLAEHYEVPIDIWPEVYFYGDHLGELSDEAAKELGLKQNTPIFMGGGDQQCSALGLGVIRSGQAKITNGTGTFVDYVTDNPVKAPEGFPIFSYPSVIKDKWHIEGALPGTGTAIKWFKDNFSQLQINQSVEENKNVYDVLTEEAASVLPASEGLMVTPLYVFRKATIHGLSLNHNRGHMMRALIESACLSAQMYLTSLERIGGINVSEVRVDGGGMNSSLWAQILADTTSKKILIPEVKDSAALGAAILVFRNSEKYSSLDNAIINMVRFIDEKNPIKKNVRIYKKLYRFFLSALLDIDGKKRVTRNL